MSNSLAIMNYQETESIATAMVASGYFSDAKKVSQAVVKIMALLITTSSKISNDKPSDN